MSSDKPNAAPPRATISTQRSSVSTVLVLQSRRSAGGTSSRVVAAGVPRPSAPWHVLHQAWNSEAPLSLGLLAATGSASRGPQVNSASGEDSRGSVGGNLHAE